ncbi:hypothetical protein HETIRDRAFT_126754 [Heterobasidion irregulare TC 32-1]|uniref:(2E,6E)-farnesyl diphosphate synthase n=1 Tax=Heterobasidion irregulare (strain TC 32-1) TaxID=747525 RepID=W4JZ48_HETIT|nr:uncharacterized protein HETIRDRAFT_126754 [Heterobasidion irregulare TC 32-1]ETW78156.1 hypothetical protein HETIRDRAFT_126754 [Heterobasidion irregulare TC 32-1]
MRFRFEKTFVTIRTELLAHFTEHGMPPDAALDCNVPGGKLSRRNSVVDIVKILKGRLLIDDEYLKAAVLGWSIGFLQAVFLVSDDFMDGSISRRGQLCWYCRDDVGTIAIKDALLLEGIIYRMLHAHFRDLIYEVTHMTEMGQLVDLITAPQNKVDLSKFSLDRHRLIVTYKTAFYSFYLPISMAMLICGISSDPSDPSDPYKLASRILLPLGEYFQLQDDYLNFVGTPEQIGKVGTDIVDNKCSWCINVALNANYGRKNPECERCVKDVLEEVGIHARYEEYEDTHGRISALIDELPEIWSMPGEAAVRREVFRTFLENFYKRKK